MDSAQGECAALKAELHGASVARIAAVDEAQRLKQRAEEAEERLAASVQELQQTRLEYGQLSAGRTDRTEGDASSAALR